MKGRAEPARKRPRAAAAPRILGLFAPAELLSLCLS